MELDLKQLVEAITKEVVNKLEGTPSPGEQKIIKSSGILAAMGRIEDGYDELLGSLKTQLDCQNYGCSWAMTDDARKKLEKAGFSLNKTVIMSSDNDVSREIFNLLKESAVLVIPVLTMADAFKIVTLSGDSFISKLVLQALFMSKKVIASPEGIFLSLSMSSLQSQSSNSRLNALLKERLDQLRNLGVELITLKNFKEHLSVVSLSSDGKSLEKPSSGCAGDCLGCGLCINRVPEKVTQIVDAGAARIGATVGVSGDIKQNLADMIDHTLLKPDATRQDVIKLCEEARKYKFASVCINPTYVSLARDLLAGSSVKVCTVIGFPLGADTTVTKAMETRDAIANGADEVDMVINVGELKAGNYELVRNDIKAVVDSAGGRIVKVILETALLNKEEKIKACELSKEAGADFVKTSTGFGPGGATAEDIALMRQVVGKYMGVKASGGIRDYNTALQMVKAGATRIGASASVAIAEARAAKGDGY